MSTLLKSAGCCTECHRWFDVDEWGTVPEHTTADDVCQGSDKKPLLTKLVPQFKQSVKTGKFVALRTVNGIIVEDE